MTIILLGISLFLLSIILTLLLFIQKSQEQSTKLIVESLREVETRLNQFQQEQEVEHKDLALRFETCCSDIVKESSE